jgi:hypothetical protein
MTIILVFGLSKMKIALILLKLIAAALVFPAMHLLHNIHVRNAAGMYIELDRAGVIDHDQLRKMYPAEFKDDRRAIARRYIGPKKNEWIVAYPCIFGFL